MAQKNAAAYDRLQLDDANDGRRLGMEGGMGATALVVTLVYLMYEALLSPPASGSQQSGKESVVTNDVSFNPNLTGWRRTANISQQENIQVTSAPSSVDLSSLGRSNFPGATDNNSNINQAINPIQSIASSRPSFNASSVLFFRFVIFNKVFLELTEFFQLLVISVNE